jgi:predicted TIM-barrel fold metal-dependent hydrolase
MRLVDAHVHVPVLGSLRPSWLQWARDFGPEGILEEVWDEQGRPRPARLDELFADQGVDVALLFCEYSPKATGMQLFDDLLPIVEHNPSRFRPVANVNPHLHFPFAAELERQLDHGAAALKLHPVHGGFRCDDRALYPAYQVLAERAVPLVVHCGTSTFPGSSNELAHPEILLPVIRDFPKLNVVLAHGGRGWWYDAAAFMALTFETVWLELSGLPPKRLPEYYAKYDLGRLARRWIFGTDWPGVPGTAQNARAVAGLGLSPEVAASVLGGNAMRVYAGLPRPGADPADPADPAGSVGPSEPAPDGAPRQPSDDRGDR